MLLSERTLTPRKPFETVLIGGAPRRYERVLGQFGLLPEARPELDLLLDAYAAQDGRHPADRYATCPSGQSRAKATASAGRPKEETRSQVNYRAFLADLQDDRDASGRRAGTNLYLRRAPRRSRARS